MTLGELRAELQKIGVKQVGAMRRSSAEKQQTCTIVFSADDKIVVPFAPKTAYFLALDSLDPNTRVNSEKYKALMRSIERDRENGKLSDPAAPEPLH